MSTFDPRPGAAATLRPGGHRDGRLVRVLEVDRAANRAVVELPDQPPHRLTVKLEHLTFPPKGAQP